MSETSGEGLSSAAGEVCIAGVALAVRYDTWSLSRSDAVRLYYQPDSRRETLSLSIGYSIPF